MDAMDETNREFRATPDEINQFEQRGFFTRENVFSPDELDGMRAAAERVHQQVLDAAAAATAPDCEQVDNQRFQALLGSTIKWEWKDNLESFRSMEPCHHLDPRLGSLVDDPRLWGPVRDLIGTERLSLFSDKLNIKRPGGAPFPWHQEGPYWVYGAEQVDKIVSALLYLDDATQENGCFWVIARTHDQGALKCFEDRGTLGRLYTNVEDIDGDPVAIEAPAGTVTWFHYNIVHGSQTNRSDLSRRVFIGAYQPAGLRRWRIEDHRDIQASL
ncbi:MAG: phytanoyl-CoA dioxygenase family protein [Myxococcales bacterium]|nr:phytanoyl-CoA dioxygenase family protein [Myxococcales bacterium]